MGEDVKACIWFARPFKGNMVTCPAKISEKEGEWSLIMKKIEGDNKAWIADVKWLVPEAPPLQMCNIFEFSAGERFFGYGVIIDEKE